MAKKTTAKAKPAAKARAGKTKGQAKAVEKGRPKKAAATTRGERSKSPARKPKKISLGRPKVAADADLDLFFKEDFRARQIFTFLGVKTLAELEEHSSEEIRRRVIQPITESIERIRERLAEHNRCLKGDEAFARAGRKA